MAQTTGTETMSKPVFGEWVSVKDRLPDKEYKRVLAWHNRTQRAVVAFANGNNKYGHSRRELFRTNLYSYWMPLPEPPKQ